MTAKQRWLDSCLHEYKDAEKLLYKCFQDHQEEVQYIVDNWDIIYSANLISLARIQDSAPSVAKILSNIYELPNEDILQGMRWLRWFVEHEIHDDGFPIVAWLQTKPHYEFVPKNSKAHPYIIRGDWLDIPFAEPLTSGDGPCPLLVEIVNQTKERLDMIDNLMKRPPREPSQLQLDLQEVLLSFKERDQT